MYTCHEMRKGFVIKKVKDVRLLGLFVITEYKNQSIAAVSVLMIYSYINALFEQNYKRYLK